ncbi:helix-turn-helix domain-containing protein [Sphingobium sp. LMA1-1-1.1]|uniref:replication protein A n=1 Tax=unclassified Sphingobium TaxID=2611147 RepID=UPI00342B0D5C
MSARSLFEIATGIEHKARRTFQPVRCNSYHAGEREGRFWRPVNPKDKWAHIRAAEAYDRQRKQAGKRNGPLGHIALELLRELYRIVDYKTGRLEPSIDYLMRQLRRSRAAIVQAMARLREHGFLEWIRRTEPTGNEGFGPQVRQITNAYRFCLPAAARRVVDRIVGKGPVPADAVHHCETAAREMEAMLASLPARRMHAMIDDETLAATLGRIGLLLESNASSPSSQNPGMDI